MKLEGGKHGILKCISTYPAPSFNGSWIVLSDDNHPENGLRLYNPAFDCYLATSFRTYVDYDGDMGNDTIVQTIKHTSEAVCTRGVSKTAAEFEVLEGIRSISSYKSSTKLTRIYHK